MKTAHFLLLACLFALPAYAQERLFVIDSVGFGYNLNTATYFYEDKTNKLAFEDVKMSIFGDRQGAQARHSTCWYKVTITNQVKRKVSFAFEPSNAPYIEFYVYDQQKRLIQKAKAGKFVAFDERATHIKYNTLALTIGYQDTLTLVARTVTHKQQESLKTVWLGSPDLYEKGYWEEVSIFLFFQGAIALMLCYSLSFFFMVRDKAYLYYALYMMSLSSFFIKDYPEYFITRNFPDGTDMLSSTSLLITIFYLQFIRYFLQAPIYLPKLNQQLSYWVIFRAIFFVVMFITYAILSENEIASHFVNGVVLLDLVLGTGLLALSWKRDKGLVIWMILGYLAIAIPIMGLVLDNILPFDVDTVFVQIGVLLELALFSLGLGYRSRVLERSRFEALQENQRIIEEQNAFLEEKVEERTIELNKQKEAVEERNNSIMDNINYARRIQEAFLPTQERMSQHLHDFFILFKPRDVVSGDFYFVEEVVGKVVAGAIDCTGHGVSGAFMTMLGNDILHNLIDNQFITSPDLLLNELHKGVRQALKQAETENRDGMDLALITIDREHKKVQYAGAKNPLIYIQNNELHLVKADKMPIGGEQQEQARLFTKHEIAIDSPTMFYLFSDGFQDQFGGEQNKKFSIARMKELFLQIHTLPLPTQQQRLNEAFEQWREQAGEKQIDDVLVMGIKIT
ncbi:MAG: hypothetical protein EAZ95_15485 [Bacteroidetes bacterium]|nr:MAG: hypothetical protein EAZ95_15485 [Bacteroidota bacterium]